MALIRLAVKINSRIVEKYSLDSHRGSRRVCGVLSNWKLQLFFASFLYIRVLQGLIRWFMFVYRVSGVSGFRAAHGPGHSGLIQRAQYPFIKEYTVNYRGLNLYDLRYVFLN